MFTIVFLKKSIFYIFQSIIALVAMEFTPDHISSLAHMLKPPDEDSDSDCELDQRVNVNYNGHNFV